VADAWLLVLVPLALAAGFTLALLVRRRRRAGHGGAGRALLTSIAPALRHPGPVLSALGPAAVRTTGPRAPQATAARLWKGRAASEQPGGPQARVPSKPVPPVTDRAWTAEVEWRHDEGSSRFCVVAQAPGESGRLPIAESSALEWPPTTPAAVQALTDAAERLEASLLDAGWTPLAQGEAWYAKRFAWQPRAERPAPTPPAGDVSPAQTPPPAAAPTPPQAPPPTAAPTPQQAPPLAEPMKGRGRFRRSPDWQEGTESLWCCEIKWDAGYVKSRFKAVVHRPGQRRGHAIGSSAEFKWQFMGDPDPNSLEYQAEVRGLAMALEAEGWQRIGRGADWYSERFVWRGEGEPPDHVEPVPVDVRRRRDVSSG
jgi:hypothetical protein